MLKNTLESKIMETLVMGLPLSEVEQMAAYYGRELSVFKRDSGEACMETCDYVLGRINVATENDIVVEFCGIG